MSVPGRKLERKKVRRRTGIDVHVDYIRCLYREDAEKIHDIMAEFAQGHEYDDPIVILDKEKNEPKPDVSIETEEYILGSISDLDEVPTRSVESISMRTVGFTLYLNCDRDSCYFSSMEDTKDARAAVDEIYAVLQKRKSRLAQIMKSRPALLVLAFLFGISATLLRPGNPDSWRAVGMGVAFAAFAITLWALVWTQFTWNRRAGILIPLYSRDAPTFWQLNGATIVISIITVAAAILGALIDRFFFRN